MKRDTALSGDKKSLRGRPGEEPKADSKIEHQPQATARAGSAALDEARLRQQAIGVRLRQMFDDVVKEPVPDDFLDILRRADKRTSENG